LLGWQWVALGALIVVTVVYFQGGVVGWVMDKYPHWFGLSRVAEDVAEDESS
jgi:branched-chain amino acid transport system permease protein